MVLRSYIEKVRNGNATGDAWRTEFGVPGSSRGHRETARSFFLAFRTHSAAGDRPRDFPRAPSRKPFIFLTNICNKKRGGKGSEAMALTDRAF